MEPTEHDLVYVVRPGDRNPELQMSLRSVAANLPHRKVWLCGYRPTWASGVESIELEPLADKFDNQIQSLRAACANDEISEQFILMNDDFFVMRPIDRVPLLHGPTVQELHDQMIAAGKGRDAAWLVAMRSTLAQMQKWGYENPLSYERHSPIPMSRERLGAVLERARGPFLCQSAYAAMTDEAGTYGPDAKAETQPLTQFEQFEQYVEERSPFISTHDVSFVRLPVGRYVRKKFPKPGPYEAN